MTGALAWLLPAVMAVAPDSDAPVVHVQGGELQVLVGEHRLSGADLIGVELDLPGFGSIRVESAQLDDEARFDDIWLYRLSARADAGSEFEEVCEPDTEGDTRAILFQGEMTAAQRYLDLPGSFSLSCISGVQAKCLRWGYAPWRTAPNSGESLQPHFEACLRLARADYCGNGESSTRDGTLIDVYDHVGVQQPEPDMPELVFEAGWTPEGAICVHHTRIPENLTLDDLAQSCPRLAPDQIGASCTEAAAIQAGALLLVRSRR